MLSSAPPSPPLKELLHDKSLTWSGSYGDQA